MTRSHCHSLLLGASLLGLAACASHSTRIPPPAPLPVPPDLSVQAAREQALAAQPDWQFAGRLGVSNGRTGGSGRIEWSQLGADADVRLSAPVTRQSWRVVRSGGVVRLEGLEGGTREGTDAEALLLEATGWRLPVEAMTAWVRGARDAGAPATVTFGDGDLPAVIEQHGWRVEYREWSEGPLPLPTKIHASRGDARVRLAIESWAVAP
jgi:outer membrane lipoprotein LolB